LSCTNGVGAASFEPVTALLAGLGLGFSLIIAIGAQNLFVLRQGIRREHVALVATICTVSDMTLIVIGISGIGAATQAWPWLVSVVRWAGAIFLVGYGVLAARRALRPGETGLGAEAEPESMLVASGGGVATLEATRTGTRTTAVALTALALTWLNPHVYLDTVFLLGSVGASHGEQRWVFAAGAMTASTVWFFGLAYGARLLSRWLAGPRAWRIVDAGIAVVMIVLGVSLVWPSA
jgi:L-lysine exporter family protein LysE/ArgO